MTTNTKDKTMTNKALIAWLTEKLRQAKRGEITGIAAAILTSKNAVGSEWTGSCERDVYKTIGGIEMLRTDFVSVNTDAVKAA